MHFCYYFKLSFITCFFLEDFPAEKYLENFPFGCLVRTARAACSAQWVGAVQVLWAVPWSCSVSGWKTTTVFTSLCSSQLWNVSHWVGAPGSVEAQWIREEPSFSFLPWDHFPQFSLIRISGTSSTSCLDGQSWVVCPVKPHWIVHADWISLAFISCTILL